jgi:hypothetical protein
VCVDGWLLRRRVTVKGFLFVCRMQSLIHRIQHIWLAVVWSGTVLHVWGDPRVRLLREVVE